MLIYKVCRYELGYNDTVCDNLETEEEFEDAENEGKSSLSTQNDTKKIFLFCSPAQSE